MTTDEITDEIVKCITLLSSAKSDLVNKLPVSAIASMQMVESRLNNMAATIKNDIEENATN